MGLLRKDYTVIIDNLEDPIVVTCVKTTVDTLQLSHAKSKGKGNSAVRFGVAELKCVDSGLRTAHYDGQILQIFSGDLLVFSQQTHMRGYFLEALLLGGRGSSDGLLPGGRGLCGHFWG